MWIRSRTVCSVSSAGYSSPDVSPSSAVPSSFLQSGIVLKSEENKALEAKDRDVDVEDEVVGRSVVLEEDSSRYVNEPTTVDLNKNAPFGRLVEHEFILSSNVLTYLEKDTNDIHNNLSDNDVKIPWSEHVANPDNFNVDSRNEDSKAAEGTNKYDKETIVGNAAPGDGLKEALKPPIKWKSGSSDGDGVADLTLAKNEKKLSHRIVTNLTRMRTARVLMHPLSLTFLQASPLARI